MLLPRLLATTVAFAAPLDPNLTVTRVELPERGLDPANPSLLVTTTVRGCRRLTEPVIERQGQTIRVHLVSESLRRSPASERACGVISHEVHQLISLGSLPRGSYRLRVVTGVSIIPKVLNIY